MKRLIAVAAAVATFGVTAAVAEDASDRNGCTPLGSWITMGNTTSAWMATMTGSSGSGTYVVVVPFWPDVPPGVSVTTVRGVWQRRNGNTFDATEFAWGVDANGTIQFTLRISGYFTLAHDCDTMTIHLWGDILTPDQDPLTGTTLAPFAPFSIPPVSGYRMKIMPPPQVQ